MNNECFDIGTIQAFLDGELAADLIEKVSGHVASCNECAIFLADCRGFLFNSGDSSFCKFADCLRCFYVASDFGRREKSG